MRRRRERGLGRDLGFGWDFGRDLGFGWGFGRDFDFGGSLVLAFGCDLGAGGVSGLCGRKWMTIGSATESGPVTGMVIWTRMCMSLF